MPRSPIDGSDCLTSVESLLEDYAKYRKRRKFLQKQIFHLNKELEFVTKLEKDLKSAYDAAREAESEMEKFAQPDKPKLVKFFKNSCVTCGVTFEWTHNKKSYCLVCQERNPRARTAARNAKLRSL
jgi:hypothetical protein